MPNILCSLVSSCWELVDFPPCEEIVTPSGKVAFVLCEIFHILLGVRYFSSRELVFIFFVSVGDGSVAEM